MATRTIGVGPGIGTPDFSSLDAWWASLPATLTEDETAQILWASAANEITPGTAQLTGKNLGGFRVTIEAAPGMSFRDHPNKATNPLRYNASVGACIRGTTTSNRPIQISGGGSGSVTIQGLQLKANGTTHNTRCIDLVNAHTNVVQNNICELTSTNSGRAVNVLSSGWSLANGRTTVFRNNVVATNAGTAVNLGRIGNADNYEVVGNTVINMLGSEGALIGLIVVNTYHSYQMFNNVSIGFFEDFRMPLSTVRADGNNATHKSSGSSGIRNAATSQFDLVGGDELENIASYGTLDLRQKDSAPKLRNNGSNLYGASTDILGQSRRGATDIGAHENQSGPAGSPLNVIHEHGVSL